VGNEKRIVFGPFQLDLVNECLWKGSLAIPLRPKVLAVLTRLLKSPGQLVTKEDLLNTIWHETFVGDAVLKVTVRQLRAATSLACLYRGQRNQEMRGLLGTIYDRFTEGFETPDLRDARALLEELS
jgi:DNA-binding response OmpR family regulator